MRAAKHDHGHQAVPSDLTLRVKALESLLVEKGLVDPAALDELIDTYEHKIGPRNGARVVARAEVVILTPVDRAAVAVDQGPDLALVEQVPQQVVSPGSH